MIAIIDYGTGNVASIQNMLNYLGLDSIITNDHTKIKRASKIILPGVGTFDKGMQNLHKLNLINILDKEVVRYEKPILGICLGMQLLGHGSEEGIEQGFGWIDMYSKRFSANQHKVPHMGWNTTYTRLINPLIEENEQKFYFVHSYYAETFKSELVFLKSNYGIEFASGVINRNIFGVQFHPEKSHKYGMLFLSKFGSM